MPLKNSYPDQHLFTASSCFVNRTKGWGKTNAKKKKRSVSEKMGETQPRYANHMCIKGHNTEN